MDRKKFIQNSLLTLTGLMTTDISKAFNALQLLPASERMPVLFVGHGNPMNAITENAYSKKWRELGNKLTIPKAILCVSAHWMTRGKTSVTAMEKPKTIHDFGGFPQALFDAQYPAPGTPEFAKLTIETVKKAHLEEDHEWGLDHGTWSVLMQMFPKATIPVYQLSLDLSRDTQYHFDLAQELKSLREKGVMIIGSGNLVHNLGMISWENNTAFDWAKEFDSKMKTFIDDRNFKGVVNYADLGSISKKAHPTNEHFLPLLYSLGVVDAKDELSYFNESIDMGSISMRSVLFS
jgi:4,5-DOPA dioxygenase extradiol